VTSTSAPGRTARIPKGQRDNPWWTFVGLLERDWRVMRRDFWTVVARSGMQPLLFVLIFGYILPRIGTVDAGQFGPILLPGILAMSTILSGMQAVTMPLAIDLGFVREIDDRLLCPIRVEWLGVEKMLFGAFQAMLSAIIVLPLALIVMGDIVTVSWTQLPALTLVLIAASLMAAALGLFIGTVVRPQQLPLIFSVIVTPLIFFGCTTYTWEQLGGEALRIAGVPWLQILVLVNPLVYSSEGVRTVLTPEVGHMPIWGIVLGLVGSIVLFGWAGLRRFRKRALE
jgi:ABC-2 type transport system permease protein